MNSAWLMLTLLSAEELMSMSAQQSARVIPDLQLKDVSLKARLRKNVSQPAELTPEQAHILAAVVLNEALETCDSVTPKQLAIHLDVSESLISRWRKPEHRERPSYVQVMSFPPALLLVMNRIVNRRFGFVRAALLNLVDAAGDLAIAVGE